MQRPPDLPDAVALARQEAGRRLAWWRRAAGLSQEQLGDRVGYSRSQVAGTERGSQRAAWDFWRRCDDALGARGALKAAHQDIEAARQAREQAAAQRAEVEREARVQRWRERHGLPQPPAGSPATASAPSDRGALVDAALAAASRPRTTT